MGSGSSCNISEDSDGSGDNDKLPEVSAHPDYRHLSQQHPSALMMSDQRVAARSRQARERGV
jgi:hypothetical protein